MIGIHIYGAAIRMLVMVSLSIMPPQAAANRPRTINQLKEFWQYDRANIENEIKAFGVDFELDYPREQELRTLGMPQTLLNLIKSQIKTGTITVQCEPVECQVSINDEAVGSTFASVLTKSQVMAGAVKVKVTAPNVETQIADVQLSAGQHLNIPKFTM